jgi:hypothetical protein
MKNAIRAINVLGLSMPILFLVYLFGAVKHTPKHDILYYDELMGFFNDSVVVNNSASGILICISIISFIIILIRFISMVQFLGTWNGDRSRFISMTVSNIITLIVWYVLCNIGTDSVLAESHNYIYGIMLAILSVSYIILIVSECQAYDRDIGVFGLKEAVKDYLYRYENYNTRKRNLINNYKKIIS